MKHLVKFILLLAVGAIFLAGCRKDSISQTDTTIPPDPVVEIQVGTVGFVVDEAGDPVEGAAIMLGTAQAKTDENGYFIISGLANAAQPFVRVEKPGFFPSLASFSARPGETGRVKVTLRTKTMAGQLDAATGGDVQVPGGGTVEFAADGFVDAAGQPYTGSVVVYATYLDPSQPQTENMVPASWEGRNAQGEAQVLLSYGMIHALLETPGGAPLQISKPAQITVPVPNDRLAAAPASIPLWYIDESTSLWVEEGSATLDGTVYKGEVHHFSWWNCDAGFPIIQLSGTLRIGNTVPFVLVRVTRPNGATSTTVPSATGYFSGGVPVNETLLLEVINECGNVVYSETIGPFTVDTDLGIISVSWTSDWVEVSGTLLDCDQNPVENGYVVAWTDNQAAGNFPMVLDPVDGSFTGAIANCGGTEVSLIGYDLDALKSSETLTEPVGQQVDFGAVTACDVQLSTGVLIEFANGNQKFMANATAVLYDPQNAPQLYEIAVVDDQGNGNIASYLIHFLDWNQNPADPLWGLSTQTNLTGQPVSYQIEGQDDNIEAIQQGTQPGELVIFRISDAVVTELPGNIEYPNCTVTITAVIQ